MAVLLGAAPAQAAVTGSGFAEQILSCTGGSNVTIKAKKDLLVLLRVAPECDQMTPLVVKATKDRTIKVTATRDGQSVRHVVKIRVAR